MFLQKIGKFLQISEDFYRNGGKKMQYEDKNIEEKKLTQLENIANMLDNLNDNFERLIDHLEDQTETQEEQQED